MGKVSGEGHGNPQQYSCWENSMDRTAWWATVHGLAKSWTWLNDQNYHTDGKRKYWNATKALLKCLNSFPFILAWSIIQFFRAFFQTVFITSFTHVVTDNLYSQENKMFLWLSHQVPEEREWASLSTYMTYLEPNIPMSDQHSVRIYTVPRNLKPWFFIKLSKLSCDTNTVISILQVNWSWRRLGNLFKIMQLVNKKKPFTMCPMEWPFRVRYILQ